MPNVDVKVIPIYRNNKNIIPDGDTLILPDDDVFSCNRTKYALHE